MSINTNRIIRLLPDGSKDFSFNIGSGADGIVESVVLQSDGKILLGGHFKTFNGLPFAGLVRLNSDGTIDVAPGTAGGSHTLTYEICEVADLSNCNTATVTVFVEVPAIAVIKTAVFNDENGSGFANAGETITYKFTVTNTGNVRLQKITIKDPLPGIVINGGPISLAPGESDNTSFRGVYVIKQSDINAGKVSNQAFVTGENPLRVIVTDASDSNDKLDWLL